MRVIFAVPFLIFILIIAISVNSIKNNNKKIKKIQPFAIYDIFNDKEISLKQEISQNHISIIYIFSSWCHSCLANHQKLFKINKNIKIYGIMWSDLKENIKTLLANQNPFFKVGYQNNIKQHLSITGVPELFIIDSNFNVLDHFKGEINLKKINSYE
jgi:thiol-disulfide isomerase/thioredoxin